MGRLQWLVLLGLLFAWPTTARATTGGNHEIDVLGHAPGDHKIYFLLEHFDSGDEPRSCTFVKTEGPHVGRVFAVRSWYRDFDDPGVEDPHDNFAARLGRLRSRLVAMETPATTFSAAGNVMASRPNPLLDADMWNPDWETKYDLEIAVFPIDDPTDQTTAGPVTAYGTGLEVVDE